MSHDVKVPLCIPEFSISKIINHRFHSERGKGQSSIGYDMIIDHDLMVELGLLANFKRQLLQQEGTTVPTKEPRCLLGKPDLSKREMRKVIM